MFNKETYIVDEVVHTKPKSALDEVHAAASGVGLNSRATPAQEGARARRTFDDARLDFVVSTLEPATVDHMQDVCRLHGLKIKGTKAELVERIRLEASGSHESRVALLDAMDTLQEIGAAPWRQSRVHARRFGGVREHMSSLFVSSRGTYREEGPLCAKLVA